MRPPGTARSSVGLVLSEASSDGSWRSSDVTSDAVPLRRTRAESRPSSPESSERTASLPDRARAATRYSSCCASTSRAPGETSSASRSAASAAPHRSCACSALARRTYALTKHGSSSSAASASPSASACSPSCSRASARLPCSTASNSSERPCAPLHAAAVSSASPYRCTAAAWSPFLKAALPSRLAASTAILGSTCATLGAGEDPCSWTAHPSSGASLSVVWKP
mmetsp:Transcript_4527/g.15017  ORF Transcript_4527/g.15017 Transcript_4527/m.15017 type:complete len:225 (+) Transcript_4527:786-1460(+)